MRKRSAVISASATTAPPAPAAPAAAAAIAGAPAPAARKSSARRTIAIAAREAGVHVETIRYYERMGLIPRPTRGASYRHYPDSTVDRLRFIRHAADHGFTLREIRELLDLTHHDEASCAEVCGRIDLKIAEIDRKIAELQLLRDHLAARVAQSPRQGPADNCKVMECFQSGHDCHN